MLDLKSYYLSPAYQLALLASYAGTQPEVKENVEFVFTEHPREQPASEVAKAILETDSDLVAASNYAWNYKKICDTLDILSATDAKLPRIVLGGPNSAGPFGEDLLRRYPIVSALVEAEGEPAFYDICGSLVDSPTKDPFAESRNCVIRTEDGDIVRPNIDHRILHLDEVPSPYLTGLIPASPSPVFYETNRGCPYRCSFCYWGNGNSKVYRMSHERIREEMEFFAKQKVHAFWIADANFGLFVNDSEIAEMMAEINSKYGRPFKRVGVNWAKNSSDRVLEIASIFKRGGMECTTTLALQSVTEEAEEQASRYAMAPSKFVGLISAAEHENIDTYTDIIWGLPGENVEEYLDGLNTVIATGVPAILIHQLYLLPGTRFFDEQDSFGLKMVRDSGEAPPPPEERSGYWDYIVVSHPKMPREEGIRGTRIIGVSHLFHNHDLGRVVGFYLSRYGLSHREMYTYFDDLLMGKVEGFPEDRHPVLGRIRELIRSFADTVGLDEFMFYRKLSDYIWFSDESGDEVVYAEPEIRAFMQDFFRSFADHYGIAQSPQERHLLEELVDYNVLISPKPGWASQGTYTFDHDVHRLWRDMLTQALTTEDEPAAARVEAGSELLQIELDRKKPKESWHARAAKVRAGLREMLNDPSYLASLDGPVVYKVSNPWIAPPSKSNSDWLLSNRSKHIIVKDDDESRAEPAESAPALVS
jgi:radical SAM superfamily enzyme YgiQ (UPF0313 family)